MAFTEASDTPLISVILPAHPDLLPDQCEAKISFQQPTRKAGVVWEINLGPHPT